MKWPHAPAHWLFEPGLYMVTAGTCQKVSYLNSHQRLDFFLESLFECAAEFDWALKAWAVLANHYHFIAASPANAGALPKFLGKLHMQTSKQLNVSDNSPGRKVWFQFWDSRITFERSYRCTMAWSLWRKITSGVPRPGLNITPHRLSWRW